MDRDSLAMPSVRSKEAQAQFIAHLLDDLLRVPGTKTRLGLDPILGLTPLVGDALVTLLGTALLLIARQLDVPTLVLVRMANNILLNGLIGAFPIIGDLLSVWFRSNAKNAALLLRAVKDQPEACPVTTRPLRIGDVALVLTLSAMLVLLVGSFSYLLWERGISLY